MYIQSNANSSFLTRILEPVSTTYAPYKVCVRTKGVNGILSKLLHRADEQLILYISHTRV